MSFSPQFAIHALDDGVMRLPWQFRVRPTLALTVLAIVSALLAMGLLFTVRRLIGEVKSPLPIEEMLLIAFVSSTVVAFSRVAWRRSFPLETPADLSHIDRLIGYASSAALVLLAVGGCFPGDRTSEWLVWLPVLVADQIWRQNFFDAGEPWVAVSDASIENFSTRGANEPAPPDANILQQLYRLRDRQGQEVVYGTLRADFQAGQRTAVVHAGFCPPLAYVPEIEAEALPGMEAKIKVAQVLAHGTRLDVRLPAAANSETQIWIDMAARPASVFQVSDASE